MRTRSLFILLLVLLSTAKSFSQTVTLSYQGEPLNDILLDLNDRFRVQISIDSELANKCLITIQQEFKSLDEALGALASECNLNFIKVADVYVFRANVIDKPEKKTKRSYLYQGTIVESGTNEPLPFSTLKLTSGGTVADENGRFSFRSYNSQEAGIFRYLGYQSVDTLVKHNNQLIIALEPELVELDAIEIVSSKGLKPITNVGGSSGHIQFNDINNNLVPGLSDNLIFNNLRLYPGIMAAGESISDFVIWGSYAGQNHVVYDGISLFNSWGINDDMGRVNPYMIKNVEVFKGGYNVQHGDRIGGVVLIDTRQGDKNEFGANLNITNQLANAYLNVPLFGKKAILQLSGRKTIFDSFDLSSTIESIDTLIVPQYDYTDFNAKLSTSFSNGDQLEISTIFSEDEYRGEVRSRGRTNVVVEDLNLSSIQKGASLNYSKFWQKGGLTNFKLSYSDYEPELTANYFRRRNQDIGEVELGQYGWTNPIQEFRSGLTHTFSTQANHQVQFSTEYVGTSATLKSNVNNRVLEDSDESSDRLSTFLHDQIQLGNNFSVQLGLKAEMPFVTKTLYLQPRVNLQYDIDHDWNIHGAWGIYNQFISKNSIVDELGNRSEVWQMADGNNLPVLESTHSVLGFNYNGHSFQLGAEGFYKNSKGFNRIIINQNGNTLSLIGESKTRGLELFSKTHIGRHEFWMSYTLSEVEERFSNGVRFSEYRQAPQSQKHELKLVAALDFHPIKFSLSNVYGSGFPNSTLIRLNDEFDSYWRTDLAIQYHFKLNGSKAETGLSILNLFDHRNVRLNQTVNTQNGIRVNTVGIPFTPTFYLNLGF